MADAVYEVKVRVGRREVPFTVALGPEGRRGSVQSREGLSFSADAISCTCEQFTIEAEHCLHLRAFAAAYRLFARDRGILLPRVKKPPWAEEL